MNEFTIINKYLSPLTKKNKGSFNLQDDIFVDYKNKLAVSVDTFSEGVHFFNIEKPNRFLKKILRSAISDLICKGIKPKYYFLSFSLKNKKKSSIWLSEIKKTLYTEQKKFNIFLSGGDTITSSQNIITITILGYYKFNPVLRNGAKLNDDIYVTGNLGDSYIGLNILKNKINLKSLNNYFVKKYYEPDICIKFSKYINKIANSSIDISDGIFQDLKHITKLSKKGALIFLEKIPLSRNLKRIKNIKKINLLNTIGAGDDYQILFTSSRNKRKQINNIANISNTKITRIGIITKSKKLKLKKSKNIIDITNKKIGFTHNFN